MAKNSAERAGAALKASPALTARIDNFLSMSFLPLMICFVYIVGKISSFENNLSTDSISTVDMSGTGARDNIPDLGKVEDFHDGRSALFST